MLVENAVTTAVPFVVKKVATKVTQKALTKASQKMLGKATAEAIEQASKLAAKEATEAAIKAGAKPGSKVVKMAAKKAATKAASKIAGEAAQKAAAAAGRKIASQIAAKIAVKIGATLAKAASKASTGIGAVLAIFDLISMGIDLADPEGYNNFTENTIQQDAIALAEYNMQTSAKLNGDTWPTMFPMDTVFAEPWNDKVTPALELEFGDKALELIPEEVLNLIIQMEEEEDESVNKKIVEESYAPDPVPEGTTYPKHDHILKAL